MGIVVVARFAARTPGVPMGYDQVDLEIDDFREKLGQSLIMIVRPTVLDDDIPPLLITPFAQAGTKRLKTFGQLVGSVASYVTNPKDFLGRLGPRRKWPNRCATQRLMNWRRFISSSCTAQGAAARDAARQCGPV